MAGEDAEASLEADEVTMETAMKMTEGAEITEILILTKIMTRAETLRTEKEKS